MRQAQAALDAAVGVVEQRRSMTRPVLRRCCRVAKLAHFPNPLLALNNRHYRTAILGATVVALSILHPLAVAADDASRSDTVAAPEDDGDAAENAEREAPENGDAEEAAVEELLDEAYGLDLADVAPPGVQWSGEVTAGFLAASGNSEARSTNAQARTSVEIGRFEHRLSGRAIQTRDSGNTTVERYTSAYQVDFTIGQRNFLFFATDFDKDLFGGVRRKTTQTAGYGRKFFETERHRLRAELGAGARQLRFQQPSDDTESELIGRFFTEYRIDFRADNRLVQSVEVESGDSNTQTESVTELRLSVIGNLFASLSYTLRHNSDVDGDVKSLDTFTAVNLTYSFGNK